MANTSIYAAFEKMWQHVIAKLSEKASADHSHDDDYYTETEIDSKLSSVNTSISNITNGNTVVAEATHAVSANSATTASSCTGNAATATKATQDASGNVITSTYETKTDATAKLAEAKSYTDSKTADLTSGTVVDNKISNHNLSVSAHNDIRNLINELTTRLNTLANSDDTTLDQMSELVAYIKSNKTLIEEITTGKVNVADIVDNLITDASGKPLSAAQGVVLKELIDSMQEDMESMSGVQIITWEADD